MNYTIKGFVIVPPLNAWDDKDKVIPSMSYRTFGLTAPEAWSKHTHRMIDDYEFSIHVQRWHDRGYRVKEATLTIENDDNGK